MSQFQNAAAAGQKDIVIRLLQQGASVNEPNRDGQTALHLAANAGHTEVVKILLDHKADPNLTYDYKRSDILGTMTYGGNTALHGAAEEGYLEIVRLLLDAGAKIEAFRRTDSLLNSRYETALAAAAKTGQANVVRLLLERGADVNPRKGGFLFTNTDRPLGVAVAENHSEATKVLLSHGATPQDVDMQNAVYNGSVPITRALINAGGNIFVRSNEGKSLLEIARERKHKEIVDLFEAYGVR